MNKKYIYSIVVFVGLSVSLYLYGNKVAVVPSSDYVAIEKEKSTEVVSEKPEAKEQSFVVSGLVASSSDNRIAVSVAGLVSECVLSDTTELKTLSFSSTTTPEKGDRVIVSYDKVTKKPVAVIVQRGISGSQENAPVPDDNVVGSVVGFSKGVITIKDLSGLEKSVDSSNLQGIVLQVFSPFQKPTVGTRADMTCIKGEFVPTARLVEVYQ